MIVDPNPPPSPLPHFCLDLDSSCLSSLLLSSVPGLTHTLRGTEWPPEMTQK